MKVGTNQKSRGLQEGQENRPGQQAENYRFLIDRHEGSMLKSLSM